MTVYLPLTASAAPAPVLTLEVSYAIILHCQARSDAGELVQKGLNACDLCRFLHCNKKAPKLSANGRYAFLFIQHHVSDARCALATKFNGFPRFASRVLHQITGSTPDQLYSTFEHGGHASSTAAWPRGA